MRAFVRLNSNGTPKLKHTEWGGPIRLYKTRNTGGYKYAEVEVTFKIVTRPEVLTPVEEGEVQSER